MADSVTRSIDSLQRLYTIVVGLALTESIRGFLAAAGAPALGASAASTSEAYPLGLLLIMVVTLVPFYHGANNYLDAAHLFVHQPVARRYTLLVDFLVLFAEGVFMVMMGLSITNESRFLFLFQALLLIDIAWAIFVYFGVASDPTRKSVVKWAIINVIAVVGLYIVRKTPLFAPMDRLTAAVSIAVIRTFADYAWNWDFYVGLRTAPADG